MKITGDITAVGNIACVDIQLESNATIIGELTLEYRDGFGDWVEKTAARRPLGGSMVNGAGQADGVLRYTFDYNETGVDRPLRVCIQTFQPDPSPKRCVTAGISPDIAA